MNREKRDFDGAAATWDEKPQRVKVARDIASAMIQAVDFTVDMNVLDFGCGTGLLTFELRPLVRTIIGADSSRGMLEIFNAKIVAAGYDNICSMHYDLEQGQPLAGRYDCIVSAMTLHHVLEIEPLLARLHGALAPGGLLCLADLDAEDGRFHDDNTGVFHFGFNREELADTLRAAGFTEVQDRAATEIDRSAADGTTNRYSVFLITCRKA